ncbi:MAG: hypothetical protein DI536_25385 [Archangium gephyra]|uniref:Uncharacterized protein n=1 Tax=Archangium gephyra TaxID=48 RepID=A0A2W5SZM8_9BACT|nr:MAG: hypothetical protein DI536_25385 [Archangium gephyra]
MSGIDGISSTASHGAAEGIDSTPTAEHGSAPTSSGGTSSMFKDIAKNQLSQFAQQGMQQGVQQMASGQQDGAPNIMAIIGHIFGGPLAAAAMSGNMFELGGILGKIFEGISKAGGQPAPGLTAQPATMSAAQPATPEATSDSKDETITDHQVREANHSKDYVGVQKKVEVSGSYKTDGLEMHGRAAAEAHAHASAESSSYNANGRVGAKAKVDASVGASAEVDGSIRTDVAQIAGRARVSAEAAARAEAEASAGLDGATARASSEVGVTSQVAASSEMSALGGMVTGEADAKADAGAGAKADARATVSFNPPQAAVDAEAGAFAGARAGFSAKGGFPGGKAGVSFNVHAGAGAKVEVHGELGADGKYRLSFGMGAAIAVGFSFKIDVEIDMSNAGSAITGIFGAAGQIMNGLFQAVGSMFNGGKGDGSTASSIIGNAAKSIGPGQLPNSNSAPGGQLSDFMNVAGKANGREEHDSETDTESTDDGRFSSHRERSGGFTDGVSRSHTIGGNLS